MKSSAPVSAAQRLVFWFLCAVATQSLVLAAAYWLAPFNFLFFWKYNMGGFWALDSQLPYTAGPLVLEGIILQLGSLVSVDLVFGREGPLWRRIALVGAFMVAGLAILVALHVAYAFILTRPDMSWWRFRYRTWLPLSISVAAFLAAKIAAAVSRQRRAAASSEAEFEAKVAGTSDDE